MVIFLRIIWLLIIGLAPACSHADSKIIAPPQAAFDLQYTGRIDTNAPVRVLNLDAFDTTAETVAALREKGVYPICYINMGATEDWRPDINDFPPEVVGKAYEGWEGEHWLDIRRIDLLAPILTRRLDMCKAKGFLGVDPDNLDGYQTDTGFLLTEADQVRFLKWLAQEAHARGLAIGLKNAPALIPQLVDDYDWVLTESCFDQKWCRKLLPFHAQGKPVYMVEYADNGTNLQALCTYAQELGFEAVLKHRELDQFRRSCD